MSEIITIAGEQIKPGQNKHVHLHVANLPTGTPIDIPVYVYRSKKSGSVLLLMAGLHGDELNGVEAIRQLIASKEIVPEIGSVIAIPVLNVYGYINFSRELPDGKDVNRSFPGNKNGSLASRVAYHFTNEILPHIDIGVDFHTGGRSNYNFPQIRCVFERSENIELAKAFGAPITINSKFRDKSLRKIADQRGKSILVYEGGESLRLSEFAVMEAKKGMMRLMAHLGMKKEYHQQNATLLIKESKWMRARVSGMFRSYVSPGDTLKKGDIIGSISDPYGEFEKKVKAPEKTLVVAINNQPLVSQGDAIAHLGLLPNA